MGYPQERQERRALETAETRLREVLASPEGRRAEAGPDLLRLLLRTVTGIARQHAAEELARYAMIRDAAEHIAAEPPELKVRPRFR